MNCRHNYCNLIKEESVSVTELSYCHRQSAHNNGNPQCEGHLFSWRHNRLL